MPSSGTVASSLPVRRRLYLALADRLDDEIARLEAARRLANPAPDVNFDELLEDAERRVSDG